MRLRDLLALEAQRARMIAWSAGIEGVPSASRLCSTLAASTSAITVAKTLAQAAKPPEREIGKRHPRLMLVFPKCETGIMDSQPSSPPPWTVTLGPHVFGWPNASTRDHHWMGYKVCASPPLYERMANDT